MATPIKSRVFVGFSTATTPVSKDDVAQLFQKLAGDSLTVGEVAFNSDKKCAHLTVTADRELLDKCIKTYNLTKWKGGVLKVEEAKPHYLERLKKEIASNAKSASGVVASAAEAPVLNKKQARRLKRLVRSKTVVLDKDIDTLVTDANWKLRKDAGWKFIKKNGRAVLVVKMKLKPDAKKPTKIDPTKYFNKITKLYPRSTISEPSVLELEWPGIDHKPQKPIPKKPTASTTITPKPTEWTKEQIMPSRTNSAKKWMPSFLDSDSEDEDHDKADTRGDKEDTLVPEELVVGEDLTDERESSLSILRSMLGMNAASEEERAHYAPVYWRETVRFDPDAEGAEALLRDPFEIVAGDDDDDNDVVIEPETELDEMEVDEEPIPSGIVEPAAQGSSYLVTTNLRSLVFGEDDEKSSGGGGLFSWLGDKPPEVEPSGPGELGDSIREKVGGVIKSTEKFSLLDALGIKDIEPEDTGIDSGSTATGAAAVVSTTKDAPAVNFGSTSLFFFHFDRPEYQSRTLFTNDKLFMRTNTIEEITQEWEDNKLHVTQDYKKKHKSATRRRTRMVRSTKGGGGFAAKV